MKVEKTGVVPGETHVDHPEFAAAAAVKIGRVYNVQEWH
jgi:hypothetical protein